MSTNDSRLNRAARFGSCGWVCHAADRDFVSISIQFRPAFSLSLQYESLPLPQQLAATIVEPRKCESVADAFDETLVRIAA